MLLHCRLYLDWPESKIPRPSKTETRLGQDVSRVPGPNDCDTSCSRSSRVCDRSSNRRMDVTNISSCCCCCCCVHVILFSSFRPTLLKVGQRKPPPPPLLPCGRKPWTSPASLQLGHFFLFAASVVPDRPQNLLVIIQPPLQSK